MSFMQANWDLLAKIILSFACGALIGLEREKAKYGSSYSEEGKLESPPGVRSFGILGLLGMLTVIIPNYITNKNVGLMISAAIVIMATLLVGFYTYYKLIILHESGITTLITLILTYAIGVGVGLGLILESIAISVFVTFILALKLRIEKLIRFLTYEELISALQIALIVFLVGPFFMTDVTDPILHLIKLKTLYVFFVLILALSYAGYIIVKALGPRALDYFSFFGGLIHSEATVVSVTRLGLRLKSERIIVNGSLTASMGMLTRNIFLILVLATLASREYAWPTLQLISLGFMPSLLVAYLMIKSVKYNMQSEIKGQINVSEIKPFSYKLAFKAVMLFLAILLLSTAAIKYIKTVGALISSIIGGLVASEALIFSVFTLLQAGYIDIKTAIASSLIASGVAVLNKLIFMRTTGVSGRPLSAACWRLLLVSIPLITVGLFLAIF